MYEDILESPVVQAGIIGFVRGVVGYIQNYKETFNMPTFLTGVLRSGAMAFGFGYATGNPAAAWSAIPMDIVLSEYKNKK
jgi:hypothetical protein